MDRFVKLKKIGEGSFGKAFLVKSKNDGGQYVVKEIGILKMNVKEREESRKEVAVLAQLNHPNIVTYKESFEEHGSLYIVMDYCAGGDLFSRISAQRGILFNENQVLDWLVQICLALKHIHDRKILHRDIKSQNIFLTTSGKVRLGDFGIAKVLNSTVELARTCIGTPYYLSPEICENKPYNNKSDIWSLGCVLYELATLKHPFESGNMKNLVLKIIRGSYPPVHCKYSYEMRNLIAQLFKRSPRDRPSVNTILKKPFLRPRIQKFLSDAEFSDEFSHTVMHGMKIQKRLVPSPGMGGRPPAAARPPSAAKRATPSPRYDPANVYGKPVVRKSRDNNKDIKDIKKRPGSAENKRPLPIGPSASLEKRRQELIAREKQRQAEARRQQFEKRHQEIVEKQKMARINRAREDNWNNLLGSGDSDKPKGINKEKPKVAEAPKQKLNWPISKNNSNDDVRGKYDHYNDYLDQLQKDRDNRAADLEKLDYMNAGPSPAPSPMVGMEPSRVQEHQRIMNNPAQQAVRQAEENRVKAGEAAERAKIVEDFLNRKKQAAVNKAKGNAEIMGRPNPVAAQRPSGPGKPRPGAAPFAVRNREEQEYLQNLRKIRLQNFNERHKLQNRVDHSASHEERKRKINALREQADQRAHQLKVNLEKEAFERKLRLMENQRQNVVPSPRDPMKFAKPAAAAPMTKILQQIGVVQEKSAPENNPGSPMKFAEAAPMTKILQQIGVVSDKAMSDVPEEEINTEHSLKEKQAEAIKKNLQENPPEPARHAWGAPSATPIVQQPDPARSQWGAEHQTLSALPLEQTESQQTDDSTVDPIAEEPISARRMWAGQAGTVLNILKDVKISSATVTLPEDESRGDRPEIVVTQGAGRLFDKVHLFEEEGEMMERGTKKITPIGKTVTLQPQAVQIQEKKLKKSGLLAGLTTGSFDAPNIQILRTCSEPDLAKLFKSIVDENSFSDHAKPSKSLELGADEIEEEGEVIGVEDILNSDGQECEVEEMVCVDEVGETGEEEQDEDEDFRTVRESMASLLTLPNDDDDDGVKVAFSLTDDSDKVNRTGDDKIDDERAGDDKTDNGDTIKDTVAQKDSVVKIADKDEDIQDNVSEQKSDDVESNGVNDEQKADECNLDHDETDEIDYVDNMDEDCKLEGEDDQIVDCSHDVSSESEFVDAMDHPRGLPTSYSQLFQSDESEEEEEDDEDEYDVFSNLEESRMELERDLGCDKFLKAYKAVQAVHEDEDEDIEAGTKIALNILGSSQEHLYPKIFQLVMADTAFTEDNS